MSDKNATGHKSQPHIRYQKSQPPQSTKASNGGGIGQNKLNKTCLIAEDLFMANNNNNEGEQKGGGMLSKRGKSLNKTGMVVIDENEDMVDIDHFYFLQ